MSQKEAVSRYNLIMKKLRKCPATFQEIADSLERESELQDYNFRISKRTFQRDLADIRLIYNIDIQYNFSEKVYFIDLDEKTEVSERILEAFDTFNALNIADRLSDHIHFEKRRPQGTENLNGLLHAIQNKVQIKFTYMKFWDDEVSERTVEPYGLKEFKNRWYVVAIDLKDKKIKSFALDRMKDLDITRRSFEFPVEFNINEHYKYCFGIISPNDLEPQEVILSFDPFQGKYIKTLPLHKTQEILEDTEYDFRIKLKICLTHDFFMELLSFGANMKVIEPKSLITDLKSVYQNALNLY